MMKKFLTASIVALAAVSASSAMAQEPTCDAKCLTGIAQDYMKGLVAHEFKDLPWGDRVGYTENGVAINMGESLWGAITAAQDDPYIATDPESGNVVWMGVIEEHGLPAYYGMRMKVVDREITEVETTLGRERVPGAFKPADGYKLDKILSRKISTKAQSPREKMVAIVEGYFNTKQLNDGTLYTQFDDKCERMINGVSTTEGEDHWAAQAAKGCQHQMEIGLYKPADRVRERRYPVVDVEKGVVVALSLVDHASRYVTYETTDGAEHQMPIEYPNTLGLMEVFKIVDGKIVRIEGVQSFLPYFMKTRWGH
jgi:hypothetical protein